MLPFEQALARILAAVPATSPETVSLRKSAGRFLAADAFSPGDLPRFDNSTMDGYAVRAADIAAASPGAPIHLRLAGRVAAGEEAQASVTPGTCVRVFTGSPLPAGADAVVMQEDTSPLPSSDPDSIGILTPAHSGENVRQRGEDVAQGAVIGSTGERLGPGQIALLAAAGLTEVTVGRPPTVGLIATGSELVEPGTPLRPGQIYESNRPALAAAIGASGALCHVFPIVADALDGTRRVLSDALTRCDAIVTSGGVSVGDMDFLKPAFEQTGGTLEFWKVDMKPGRPFVFGRYRHKLLFGLPGNPVSALITFLLLVRPALLRWQGARDVSLPGHPAQLAEPLTNDGARRHFIRVRVDGAGKVFSAGTQASHILSSMAAANALVEVPANTTLPTGAAVTVLRLSF